ncbi:hypothetical protein ASZ78_005584 [Callipepla squamata]|uniref:RNA/RNP complex-1-interacting phosphatase n=1 Tax=Callipepla squamata TaxID=9009 RepID=A0A226MFK3_CALSU|nr:hypothetical protein ASZ78_005584 [Callipepla squamata]
MPSLWSQRKRPPRVRRRPVPRPRSAAGMPRRGRSRVPERWTDYAPLGRRLPGTRFIAFKVPLRKSFNHNLHPEERFSPCDLIEKIKEQKEELGLIIDLTYTTRYYGPEELPATLSYSKILTMGHEIPNNQTIFQFKCVVKNFLRDNKDNDKLIGVHCTHGLNRTGYLSFLVGLLRYLIDVEGMEPNAAIECTYIVVVTQTFLSPVFNRARGHPIERMNYIEDLQRRSGMNSGCAKKKKKRHHRVPEQQQELVHKPGMAEQRWPRSWGSRNCPVSLPYNTQHNEVCFLAPSPLHQQPQETHVARKRWRRR